MVRLGELRSPLLGHSPAYEFAAEAAHSALPPHLEAQEPDTDLHGEEGDGCREDHREAVPGGGHHSSPLPRDEMAFAIVPPRFRDDMYCSVSLKACSSVIPLSFRVR